MTTRTTVFLPEEIQLLTAARASNGGRVVSPCEAVGGLILQNEKAKSMQRITLIIVLAGGLLLAVPLINAPQGQAQGPDNEESKIKRGFEIAPVPLNLKNKKPLLGGLGQLHRQCPRGLQRLSLGRFQPLPSRW